MARPVFYSFHYDPDNWRASQVRNMGVVDGNEPAKDHDWETITKGGEAAIKKWIDGQLNGRTCTAVLIGAESMNLRFSENFNRAFQHIRLLLQVQLLKLFIDSMNSGRLNLKTS